MCIQVSFKVVICSEKSSLDFSEYSVQVYGKETFIISKRPHKVYRDHLKSLDF